jgi:integrase
MTWEKARFRWRKMYKGKVYTITPKELNCLPTKDDSWQAANAWWQNKVRNLPNLDPASSQVNRVLQATGIEDLKRLVEKGQAALKILQLLTAADTALDGPGDPSRSAQALEDGVNLPPEVIPLMVGHGSYVRIPPEQTVQKLTDLANKVIDGEPSDPARSVKHHAAKWKKLLQGSNERRLADARMLDMFVKFLGAVNVDAITEERWQAWFAYLKAKKLGDGYKARLMRTARNFVHYLYEGKYLPDIPRNLGSRLLSFKQPVKQVRPLAVQTVRTFYKHARNQTRLHCLLGLNCGFLACDISDLQDHEVDWKAGTITRKRSKTQNHKDVPTVTYKLWPSTFRLLKEYRSGQPTVLVTQSGSPWILEVDGKSRSDSISSTFRATCRKAKVRVAPKDLRTTSASMLAEHPTYKFYTDHFLGHSPRTVTERHYQRPSDTEFFQALKWLEKQYDLSGPNQTK